MLDNKGRLFGKVNIVDLLIVIIIIAAGIFLGRLLFGPESTIAQTEKVRITLYCEETPDYVAEQLTAATRPGIPRTTSPWARWSTGARASPRAPSPTSPGRSSRSPARTTAPSRSQSKATASSATTASR